jgi:hypothetical protein
MNRRKLSHVIAAGILAALLVLPGPALAQSTHHRSPVDFWSWLAGWISNLGSWSGSVQKVGPGVDPNGGGSTGSGGSTGQSALTGGTTSGATGGGTGPGTEQNG